MSAPPPGTPSLPRLALRFGLWMVFAMALFQSVTVTVAWWTGELADPGAWDWLWIGALPVLVGVYLRFFSILGCREDRCGG
ncbi:MAG: hypothetical protein MUF66_14115 [Gammaproteobacteria bacterium]|nr:hypothetical protein [Gammaproteobacteria bacterium]